MGFEQMSNAAGGDLALGALAVSVSGLGVAFLTRNAWTGLAAGFGACWVLTIFGIVEIWVSGLCTLAVIGFYFARRRWFRA